MFNSPEFQALRREYLQGALERCTHLQEEAGRLRTGAEVDLTRLRQEIHKFRGSGGFYGFAILSASSASAEDHLVAVLAGELPRDDRQIAALVDQVVASAEAARAELSL